MAKLAAEFVCVRIQSMNGVNINLFQFDGDLTWMSFFMDAHDHFYARYGGREDSGPESLLSKASLVSTMKAVLSLHKVGAVQAQEDQPAGKPVLIPEDIPSLKVRLASRKEGQRCIHCHDVKQAQLQELQAAGKFTKDMIFSYPLPSVFDFFLDRDQQNKVRTVDARCELVATEKSLRFIAGNGFILPDAIIQKVNGKRVLTAADFAWILERMPNDSKLTIDFLDNGKPHFVTIRLSGNWRRSQDPSWRSSTYVAGPNAGFWAEPLSEALKEKAGLAKEALALRVTVFFGGQLTPVKSGLKLNDVVVEFDGKRQPMTIRQLHTHCQMDHGYGDKIPVTVLRGGKEVKLTLELPAQPAKLE